METTWEEVTADIQLRIEYLILVHSKAKDLKLLERKLEERLEGNVAALTKGVEQSVALLAQDSDNSTDDSMHCKYIHRNASLHKSSAAGVVRVIKINYLSRERVDSAGHDVVCITCFVQSLCWSHPRFHIHIRVLPNDAEEWVLCSVMFPDERTESRRGYPGQCAMLVLLCPPGYSI